MKTKPTEALKLIDETESIVRNIEIEAVTKLFASLACKLAFKEGQSNPKIKQLEWFEEQCSNENIPYNHVKALSPLGVYTIEWKGWKDYDDKTIYLDGFFVSLGGFVLEDAKILAQADFEKRIKECLL